MGLRQDQTRAESNPGGGVKPGRGTQGLFSGVIVKHSGLVTKIENLYFCQDLTCLSGRHHSLLSSLTAILAVRQGAKHQLPPRQTLTYATGTVAPPQEYYRNMGSLPELGKLTSSSDADRGYRRARVNFQFFPDDM